MTDEKVTPKEQNTPVFRLQKMYVKDLSFENPNAPNIFLEQQNQPEVEVNLGLKNKKLQDDHYEILLSVTATVTNGGGDDKKTLFIVEIEHGAVFLLKNIPAEHLPVVLSVDCPNLLFPYTRQILSQVSVDGGFIPFMMEPVNFLGLYQNAQQKEKEKAQA